MTKTLLISLLLSVVVPSGLQANLFTAKGKEFAKSAIAAGTLGVVGAVIGKRAEVLAPIAGLGSLIGSIIAERETVIEIQVGEGAVEVERAAAAVGSGVGAAAAVIGAVAVIIGKEVIREKSIRTLAAISVLAAGAGTGAVVGSAAGKPI